MIETKECPFLENVGRLFAQHFGGDPLKAFRDKAFDHFLELGLPEKKEEAFHYLPLGTLYDQTFDMERIKVSREEIEEHILPECSASYVVFINGYFEASLSVLPPGVVVLPSLEAARSYGPFLHNRWSKTLKEETDPFALLNLALYPKGLFIYVPPGVQVQTPLQALYFSTGSEILSLPRIELFLGASSSLRFVSKTVGRGFSSNVLDLSLEEGARFERVGSTQGAWHFEAVRATLKKGAFFKSVALAYEVEMARQSYHVNLAGEESEAILQGLWTLEAREQAHTHVVMEHRAPEAKSLQKFKGVLDDVAHSSFEGKIFVHKEAQKTQSYQSNNNLLLSDHALCYSKPNLEIFADDVKASHGATVSQCDEEQSLYLQSRGLSKEVAQALLTKSYIDEILNEIPYPSLRNRVPFS